MPLVGVNNEPLLERAFFGYDGTNYRVAKLDTDGNIVVALKAEEDVQANGYGWISSAWQKNPILFGYSGTVSEEVSETGSPGGTRTLNGTVVPSGEIWVVAVAGAFDNSNAPARVLVYMTVNSVVVNLITDNAPVAQVPTLLTGQFVLAPGDKVSAALTGVTAGDNLYLRYGGYKVDIDQ